MRSFTSDHSSSFLPSTGHINWENAETETSVQISLLSYVKFEEYGGPQLSRQYQIWNDNYQITYCKNQTTMVKTKPITTIQKSPRQ